jgi:hypothetical protein
MRAESLQFNSMVGEAVAVTQEVPDTSGQVSVGPAAVEYGDFMAPADQPPYEGRADEVRAADDKDSHGRVLSLRR